MGMDSENVSREGKADPQKAQIVQPGVAVAVASVIPPIVKTRTYYSKFHHWSAAHFSWLAGQIEDSYQGSIEFDIKHRSYVTASVFAAVSFMESAINELFKDAFDSYSASAYVIALDPSVVIRLSDVWTYTEAANKRPFSVFDKYSIALSIAGKPELKKGEAPYQDARLLVQLRNELVHFKPETLGGTDTHHLEDKLQNKFPLNKLMDGMVNPFFPDHCLGHGCSEWAVKSSEAFVDEFFDRITLTAKYRETEMPDPTKA